MATATTVNNYVDAAITAIEAEDWATAYRKLLAAKAALSSRVDVPSGDTPLQWHPSAIDQLIRDVRGQLNAGVGIQRSKVVPTVTSNT